MTKQAVKKHKYISGPLSMDKERRSGRLHQTNQNWNKKYKETKKGISRLRLLIKRVWNQKCD